MDFAAQIGRPPSTAEPVSPGQFAGLTPRMQQGELYLLRSNSMFPALRAGDLLLFREGSVEVGDIVAYRRGGEETAFVHRVVQIDPAASFPYVVKGDNCFAADDAALDCRLLGRLCLVWRGGRLIDFEQPFRRLLGRGLAQASRRNLLPELLKTRFSCGIGDWLRDHSLVVAATAMLVREDLHVHHFPPPAGGGGGDFSLRRGPHPVGGLHYRLQPAREGQEARVESCWLRFPFSYGVVFAQLVAEAEGQWRSQNLCRAVFPIGCCRPGLQRALARAGYAPEEQAGGSFLARFL